MLRKSKYNILQTNMAGDAVVDKWILEYACYKAWKEFEQNKSLSNRTVDFISAVLGTDLDKEEKIYFLVVLCRINDGEKIYVEYETSQKTTVLEDVISCFENLANQQNTELKEEGLELIDRVIKSEAVLVCCRQGEYSRANEVFQRQWAKVNHKSKKKLADLKILLKDIVNQKAGTVDQLKGFTYTNFIDSLIKYLSKVQNNFSTPLLLKAAGMKRSIDDQHEKDLQTKPYANKRLKKDDITSATDMESENKSSKTKAKLTKLWNNKLTEVFGSQDSGDHITVDNSQYNFEEDDRANVQNDNSKLQKKQTATKTSSPKLSPIKSVGTMLPPKKLPISSRYFAEPSPVKSPKKRPQESSPKIEPKRPVYRKNEGRPNRHEPTAADNGDNDAGSSSDDNMSIMSVSSRRKWTESEAEDLYDAVKIFGVGQWAKIRDHLCTTRTNVMIKDKWRTMVKRGDVERIKAYRSKKKKTDGK